MDAQKAVDYLADHQFPVQMVSIVGNELKMVERGSSGKRLVKVTKRVQKTLGEVQDVVQVWNAQAAKAAAPQAREQALPRR